MPTVGPFPDPEIPDFDVSGMMIPPWIKYPNLPRESIGWRMGSGERYRYRWIEWYCSLASEQRIALASRYPDAVVWEGFYEDADEFCARRHVGPPETSDDSLWNRYANLLVEGSAGALARFFTQHPRYDLCAVGYTFELWNNAPAFHLCANSRAYFRQTWDHYRADHPKVSEEVLRWNSGDYEFCAGLGTGAAELGWAWESEYYPRLHEVANHDAMSRFVYDGLIDISCDSLVALVKRGVIPNWKEIDFNVAEYGDGIDIIQERHRKIRGLIESGHEPA